MKTKCIIQRKKLYLIFGVLIGIFALAGVGGLMGLWIARPEIIPLSKALVYTIVPEVAPEYLQEIYQDSQQPEAGFIDLLLEMETDLIKHQTGREALLHPSLCKQGIRYMTEDIKRHVWNSDAPEDCVGLTGAIWTRYLAIWEEKVYYGFHILFWINPQKVQDKSFSLQISTGKRVIVVPLQTPKSDEKMKVCGSGEFVYKLEQDGKVILLQDLFLPNEYDEPWQIKLLVDQQPQVRSIEILPKQPLPVLYTTPIQTPNALVTSSNSYCSLCSYSPIPFKGIIKQKLQETITQELEGAKSILADIDRGLLSHRTVHSVSAGIPVMEDKTYYEILVAKLREWQEEKVWDFEAFPGGVVGAMLFQLPEDENCLEEQGKTSFSRPQWEIIIKCFYPPAIHQDGEFLIYEADDKSKKITVNGSLNCNGPGVYGRSTISLTSHELDEFLHSDCNNFMIQMCVAGTALGDAVKLEKQVGGD